MSTTQEKIETAEKMQPIAVRVLTSVGIPEGWAKFVYGLVAGGIISACAAFGLSNCTATLSQTQAADGSKTLNYSGSVVPVDQLTK